MCSLGWVFLSSLKVSKLQLNFTSSSSSQVLQPSIAGPGTSVTLKMISLILPFVCCTQSTGSKGLDGVASVCGNPLLHWAKMSTLGIGVESVIILFGDNIYFCTSVNLAGKGYHVCIMGVCCDLNFGHDFVTFFFACDCCRGTRAVLGF